MTSAVQLIAELGAAGIQLHLDEQQQLRFRAPKGAMTAEFKQAIVDNKPDIIQFLQQSTQHSLAINTVKREPGALYDLSPSQQRFYFLDSLQEGDIALNIPALLKITGALNSTRLNQAFTTLIQRQEALRTVFIRDEKNQIKQKLLAPFDLQLETRDISQSADIAQQLQNASQAFALMSFDLSQRLFHCQLLKTAENQHYLLITLHHIICDGWSIDLMIKELCIIYQALEEGRPHALPDLAINYLDYSQYQIEQNQSAAIQKQLDYWKNALQSCTVLDLALDFPRPKQSHSKGQSLALALDNDVLTQLEHLAIQQKSSLFNYLFSAFATLLYRYSGQVDFCIGTPVSGRKHAVLEPIMGCFINLLAIACNIKPEQSFSAFSKELAEQLLQAQENQDIAFEEVARACTSQRSQAISPLFQVLFTYQQANKKQFNLNGLTVELQDTASVSAKYDLQLHVEHGAQSQLIIEYNCQLFLPQTIQAMLEAFSQLLSSIASNADCALNQLEIFNTETYPLLLPSTKLVPEKQTLNSLLKLQDTHILQTDKQYDGKQLALYVNAIGQHLQQNGIQAGHRVGILLDYGLLQIASVLACIRLHITYVPMDSRYPKDRLDLMTQSANLAAIISHASWQDKLSANLPFLAIDALKPSSEPLLLATENADEQQALYCIFTSGSTGTPKAAAVSHANEANLLQWYVRHYQINSQDTFLVFSALGFDLTQKNLLAPFASGANLAFPPSALYDPLLLLNQIQQQQITIINCAPSAFYPIVALASETNRLQALASLRLVLFGGEPIKQQKLTPWLESPYCHAQIDNMYGPTECTDITTVWRLDKIQSSHIPIGQSIDNVNVYLLDADLNSVPLGAIGELYIAGNSVGLGYLQADENQRFIDNPFGQGKLYRSGDKARLLPSYWPKKVLSFIERVDNQIKIRGYRIELDEIAKQLGKLAGIVEAQVFADQQNQQLLAYYIANAPQQAADLRQQLQQVLPDYMLPSVFIAIQQWPLSANGKVDAKQLPKPAAEDFIKRQFIAPNSLLEQQLTRSLEDLLNIDAIGIEDDFFELGGHSLLAVQWIADINQQHHSQIALADFFANANIHALAKLIEQGSALHDANTLLSFHADRSQPQPLSPAQKRLWIIEQFNPGSSVYNIPLALEMVGELNQNALMQAIKMIIVRHESLRTRIEGQHQIIDAAESIVIEQSQIQADGLKTHWQQFAERPFILNQDHLTRIELVTLSAQRHVLMLCMHHMISDAWSLTILQKELSQIYNALCQGKTPQLPTLAVQYVDFSQWQLANLQDANPSLDYWLDTLKSVPRAIDLPFDYPRPKKQSFNGGIIETRLNAAFYQQIKQFSQAQSCSVFTTLISLYAWFLHKLSQQETVCIGTPVAGRPADCLHEVIGYFINAVVIRSDNQEQQSFTDFVQQIKQQSQNAFANQEVAIETVLEHLQLERNISHAPISQVGFSFINAHLAKLPELEQLQISSIDYEKVLAKYELTLIAIEDNQELLLQFEYNSDVFKPTTVERFAAQFTSLCQTLLLDPAQSFQALSLFNNEDICHLCQLDESKIEAIYPLSPMQKDLVFSQIASPQSLANTIGYRAEMATFVDAALWQQACQIVCQEEPITRTLFAINPLAYGELAWQYTLKQLDVQLEVMDYRTLNLDKCAIDEKVHQFIYRPEAYLNNQLIRYGLMHISDTHSILLLSAHHGILDGVSIVLIAQKALKHYEALADNAPIDNVINPFDYATYLADNRKIYNSAANKAFWQKQFQTCEALSFAGVLTEQPKQQVVKQLFLPEQLTQQLRQYCRQNRMTVAQLLKLTYGLLISQYCQAEKNFYFNEFHAGRDKGSAEQLGCFFQQSAFIFPASELNHGSCIDDLFAYLRQFRKTIKAFDALSLSACHALAPQGTLQFMYNFYHFFPVQQTLQGHPITCIEMPPFIDNTVQFIAKEHETTLLLDLYYQNHCFDDLNFLQRMQSLLEQIVSGKQRLADLSFVIDDASQSTGAQAPMASQSLAQCFAQQALKTPNATALIDNLGPLSYQALDGQSNQLAHYLQGQGLKSGMSIGLLFNKNRHAITAILAAVKLGVCYIPIDKNYPEQRIKQILEQANLTFLLSDEDIYQAINCQNLEFDQYATNAPLATTDLEQALYIIFTSGSTGTPKGAAVSLQNELNLLQWYCQEYQFNETSRTLIISALGFDLTQKNLFAPLISGGQLILHDASYYDSLAISQLIDQHQISHINCAPSAFYPLIESHQVHLASLKQVILGGEAISFERLKPYLAQNTCQISNHYGPTECTDIALFHALNPTDERIPLGRAPNNVQVRLVNRFYQRLPQGLIGEIAISGAGVGLGYINGDNQAFVDIDGHTHYLTGDLAYQMPCGNMMFVARKDFQVKLRGLRIELGEIEQALKQCTAVQEALVLIDNDKLIAYLQSQETLDIQAIKDTLAEKLPTYMQPAQYVTLSQWPLNAHGKIDRSALPKPQTSSLYVAPRDEVESKICAIIEQVLNLEKVSVLDNFFDLGGHSLAASRAIVQIREQFTIELPLAVLFDMTTVEKLANYIKASQWAMESAKQHEEGENRDTGFI